MRINNNLMSMNTYRQYSINTANAAASTEKLSSGYRINRAGDDAAGLAISEKMRAQIRGLNMASKNSQDAISLVQTAEGALTETHSILQRMRELANQSASDTNDDSVDRTALQAEFTALRSEINDIAGKTAFNGKKLLDGSFGSKVDIAAGSELKEGLNGVIDISISGFGAGATIDFSGADAGAITATISAGGSGASSAVGQIAAGQPGQMTFDFADGKSVTLTFSSYTANTLATSGAANQLQFTVTNSAAKIQTGANTGDATDLSIASMRSVDLAAGGALDSASVATRDNASAAIDVVDEAINTVSTQRSQLGAIQNRLQHKINNLDTSAENLTAAESRIRDLDMAKEMTNYTKNNILVQAATAMLAQANSAPQGVLQLLQ